MIAVIKLSSVPYNYISSNNVICLELKVFIEHSLKYSKSSVSTSFRRFKFEDRIPESILRKSTDFLS